MRKGRNILLILVFAFVLALAPNVAFASGEEASAKIIGFSGESSFSCFITDNNYLHVLGDNSCGQLGIGIADFRAKYTPQTIGNLPPVKSVDSGSKHVVALTDNGKAYSWGNNCYGQLGLYGRDSAISRNIDDRESLTKFIDGRDASIPNEIIFDSNVDIVQIACGSFYTLFLDSEGRVWSCGLNQFGELGTGAQVGKTAFSGTPKLVNIAGGAALDSIESIAAGASTAFALSKEGRVYAWGSDYYGLLSDGKERNDKNVATLIKKSNGEILEGVTKISAAEKNILMQDDKGAIFILGDNSYGQAANGSYSRVAADWIHTVQEITYFKNNGIKIKNFLCGGISMFILSENNEIFAWGLHQNGALGIGAYDNLPQSVKGENTVNEVLIPFKISFGDGVVIDRLVGTSGNRAFAADTFGTLWGWGDNSFGQLGNNDDSFKNAETPVVSTLTRNSNYDKLVKPKNYLVFPIIFIAAVAFVIILMLAVTAVKSRKLKNFERKLNEQ